MVPNHHLGAKSVLTKPTRKKWGIPTPWCWDSFSSFLWSALRSLLRCVVESMASHTFPCRMEGCGFNKSPNKLVICWGDTVWFLVVDGGDSLKKTYFWYLLIVIGVIVVSVVVVVVLLLLLLPSMLLVFVILHASTKRNTPTSHRWDRSNLVGMSYHSLGFGHTKDIIKMNNTVDGGNPAPRVMYKTL